MILSDDINKCSNLLSEKLPAGIELTISSDTRKLDSENCFLSLYGENFDSIKFMDQVLSKNVSTVLIEKREQNEEQLKKLVDDNPSVIFVLVKNIFDFILELGRVRSMRFQEAGGLVIGLTGSNGKTTNKEMLKHLLSFMGEEFVHSTKGNLNNQIGVPLTLFDVEDGHKVSVVEMGTNFHGEIEILAKCGYPKVGYITNIGYAHIEFLKSLDGVFEEKTALYREVTKREDGLFFVNGLDEKLKALVGKKGTRSVLEDDFKITEKGFTLNWSDTEFEINNPALLGDHQKLNMAMCMTIILSLYPQNASEIVEKAKNFTPPNMNRGEIRKVGDTQVYLDAYNANPSSMNAALKSFYEFLESQKLKSSSAFIVLGDMNELGDSAASLHKEVAEFASSLNFSGAAFVGRYAKDYQSGYGPASKTFATTKEFREWFKAHHKESQVFFIKGSRSLQLESILDINE